MDSNDFLNRKREYENEIINLKMSINDNNSEDKCEIKKINFIPVIILWILVIIMLIIILISMRIKRKSSFVESV